MSMIEVAHPLRASVSPLRANRATAKVYKGKNIEKGISNPTCLSINKYAPLVHAFHHYLLHTHHHTQLRWCILSPG